MPTKTTAPAGVVLKPVRLNFAQFCMWCGQRWCESPKCIDMHDRSVWLLCDECGGSQDNGCSCCGGLIEANTALVAQLLAESREKLAALEQVRAGQARMELVCYGSDADNLVYVWEKR